MIGVPVGNSGDKTDLTSDFIAELPPLAGNIPSVVGEMIIRAQRIVMATLPPSCFACSPSEIGILCGFIPVVVMEFYGRPRLCHQFCELRSASDKIVNCFIC